MLRYFLIVISCCFTALAIAAEPDINAIKAGLAHMFPGTQFDSLKLRTSEVPGLYEGELDSTVFYVTSDGKYVFIGDVVDIKNRNNLTENRRQTLAANIINGLPEKNMIVMGPKDAKRTITVFTDVDCVYCRRLHTQDVPELTKQGVKVRYLLYPRSGPGTETYNKAIAVWCASDRVKAVGEAKVGKAVAMKSCTNPIAENHAVAERLGVNGTPAIFLEDGRRLPGYVPADQMLTLLGLKNRQAKLN